MSGETRESISGWTTDTVLQALREQISHTAEAARLHEQALADRIDREHVLGVGSIARIDAQVGAAIELARRDLEHHSAATQRQLDDLRDMLLERYQTQQVGLQTALTAAERATASALASAEKAVVKAEVASDKRFDAVNEFRQQLNDQAATFPSRIEVDARLTSLAEKLEALTGSNAQRITELASRVDREAGSTAGTDQSAAKVRAAITIGLAVATLVISVVVVMANLLSV